MSITHHTYKAGWLQNTLYLEAHPPISHNEMLTPLNYTSVEDIITQAIMYHDFSINWKAVEKVVQQQTGIPTAIGRRLG